MAATARRTDPAADVNASLATSSPATLRQRILDVVQRFPGLHLREVARTVNVAPSHAQYHLRVLEKTGFVVSESRGVHLVYYGTKTTPVGQFAQVPPADRRLLDLFRRPSLLRLIVVLTVDGPLHLAEVARRCGLTPPTVLHHLHRLAPLDLVVHDASGWRVKDAARMRALLMAYEPPPRYVEGFLDTWSRLSA